MAHFTLFVALLAISNGALGYTNTDGEYSNEFLDMDRMHNYYGPSNVRRSAELLAAEDATHWITNAQATLAEKLKNVEIKKEAKNVVFFLGDGMSLPTVTASRIFKGQLANSTLGGEEASLFFEGFPNIGVSKTFCSDSQVADSACSATAYLSGIKANIMTIGVKPTVLHNDCKAQMNVSNQVESVLAWAQAAGKSTGVVTTTRITHASPAGTYAHIANRDWENDQFVADSGADPNTCDDIAEQLILRSPGQNINVILGGGRREFIPKNEGDPENSGQKGRRADGVHLIDKWVTMKNPNNSKYVWNKTNFEAVNTTTTDFLLGLFNYDHLDYVLDDDKTDPSLPELVAKAIAILSKNPKGFFLFVEGGRIDHAHHDTLAQKAFVETITMDKAVQTAASLTNINDTLILVTSDHAHTMSISGYPHRGNPLLHTTGSKGSDGLPFTTISYANGPGYKNNTVNGTRYNITDDPFDDKDYRQMTGVPLDSETHGGDDVMIFSQGPFSHLLTGVVQQSYIPHVVGFASCTGSGLQFCDWEEATTDGSSNGPGSTVAVTGTGPTSERPGVTTDGPGRTTDGTSGPGRTTDGGGSGGSSTINPESTTSAAPSITASALLLLSIVGLTIRQAL